MGVHGEKEWGQKPDCKGYIQVADVTDTGGPRSLGVERGKKGWANSVRESQDRGRIFFFICLFLGCRDLITFRG